MVGKGHVLHASDSVLSGSDFGTWEMPRGQMWEAKQEVR